VPPLEAYSKVREAALKALKIDNDEAEAHVYLAETKRILDWDLDGAEAEFNRAVEIEPNSTASNYFIAALYAARGEREKALAYLQRTSKIDPASLWVNNSACELYRYFGLHDEAIAAGNARCNSMRHFSMASRYWRHSIARWGASMRRLRSTRRRRVSGADQDLVWLLPTRG
jgi:tetratricopeptide (TPR) repeat protein